MGHLEKRCSGNPSRNQWPRVTPLAAPAPLPASSFLEHTLLLILCGEFVLNCSEKGKKKTEMHLYQPPSLCSHGLLAVLEMVEIKPIKTKLPKSIKFFALHPFVVREHCMFSSSYLPKQQSHLLFDLCKLKQVWSSLGSELWLHLLVKLFIQAIPTL